MLHKSEQIKLDELGMQPEEVVEVNSDCGRYVRICRSVKPPGNDPLEYRRCRVSLLGSEAVVTDRENSGRRSPSTSPVRALVPIMIHITCSSTATLGRGP